MACVTPACKALPAYPLTVTGVIAHGWCTCVFVQNQDLQHGASAAGEKLMRTLDVCYDMAQQRGVQLPSNIVLQADNTTAQSKNSVTMLLDAYLVASARCSSFTNTFLVTGHTKEDIDRLFSWPQELGDTISARSGQQPQGPHCEGEKLVVQEVHHIRNFDSWLSDASAVKLSCSFAPARDGTPAENRSYGVASAIVWAPKPRLKNH